MYLRSMNFSAFTSFYFLVLFAPPPPGPPSVASGRGNRPHRRGTCSHLPASAASVLGLELRATGVRLPGMTLCVILVSLDLLLDYISRPSFELSHLFVIILRRFLFSSLVRGKAIV